MALFEMKSGNPLLKIVASAAGAAGVSALLSLAKRSDRTPDTNGSERLAARQFSRDRHGHERRTMRWAIGWSAANLVAAFVAPTASEESAAASFHAVNAVSNAAGGLGAVTRYLVARRNEREPDDDIERVLATARRHEAMLIAKQGINLPRMAVGAALCGRGISTDAPRFIGAGAALLLYGTATTAFDSLRLATARRKRREFEAKVLPEEGRWQWLLEQREGV